MYIFRCEYCGRFFGSHVSWQKWCSCKECQRDKQIQKRTKRKKYRTTHINTNWTSYKFGKCFNCGKLTQLNRFNMCLTCYEKVSNDNLEGDFLYTDVAISDLDRLIGGVYSEAIIR